MSEISEVFPIEMMDAREMSAHPQNFRRHPQSQVTQISKSLKKFGWLQNVVWNKQTGYILNGHARIELAAKAGEKVPVRVVDVTPEVEKQILLALDKTGEGAGIDEKVLTALLQEVVLNEDDLPPGWSAKDLEALIESTEPPEDEEEDEEGEELAGTGLLSEDAPSNIPLASIRMVQLFLTQEVIENWNKTIQDLSTSYGTDTVTDTVVEAVNRAWAIREDEQN